MRYLPILLFLNPSAVSGRLAGRVQTFWFVTGGGVQ
jgi:hypothetical protein